MTTINATTTTTNKNNINFGDSIDGMKVWIMICTLLSNSAYATIAPLLPIELEYHNVSDIWSGPIFAIYSIAVIVISPLRAKLFANLDNGTAIAYGMIGMGISLASFGLIMYSSSTNWIIIAALISRFVQGASSAFIQTSCYVIATNDYPQQKEQIVGLIEAMTGVGLLLGPVIGSALYAATNFEINSISVLLLNVQSCVHHQSQNGKLSRWQSNRWMVEVVGTRRMPHNA